MCSNNRALSDVAHASMHLLTDPVTNASPKDREVEAVRRARAEKRSAAA